MPPKLKPTTTTSSASVQEVELLSAKENKHEEDDSRPQTPSDDDGMNFSDFEQRGIFFGDEGKLEKIDNERKSEVFTAIGYTCNGTKTVVQAWEPYSKNVNEFFK